MAGTRALRVDRWLRGLPEEHRYQWCSLAAGGCACQGCANIHSDLTLDEWRGWVEDHPRGIPLERDPLFTEEESDLLGERMWAATIHRVRERLDIGVGEALQMVDEWREFWDDLAQKRGEW